MRNGFLARHRLLVIVVSLLLVLAVVWGLFFAFQGNSKGKSTPSPTATSTTVLATVRSVTGKSAEEDKKAASDAVTAMLQMAATSPTGASAEDRIQSLDESDYSVVDKNLVNLIHFSPDADENFKKRVYQSLVTMATIVKKSSNDKIALTSDDVWKKFYADQASGTVFVPLGSYVSEGALFSFEMSYVDGHWQLMPYSMLDAVNISAAYQNRSATPQPTATK